MIVRDGPAMAEPLQLEDLLRCPKCGGRFVRAEGLRCSNNHRYPIVHGVPRLLEQPWGPDAALAARTSEAFGQQWVGFAEQARVGLDDLLLHLPYAWSPSIYRGLVLDAGCGMGRYTTLVGQLGAAVIGLDVSEAAEAAAQLWNNAVFVRADIASPPFAPESFDVVYSLGVLHHLPDPLRGFKTCFDLVKPGGLLLVWVYSEHGGLLRKARRLGRRIVNRFPALLRPAAWCAAFSIWSALIAPRRMLGMRGGHLASYQSKSLGQLHVDCYDALSAPVEVYLTADDCRHWLSTIAATRSGFERRRDGSGWILWSRR